ncbi:MAG: hypothetical protein Q7S61_04015 [bacterium]|nr:hypothetical protein [bacterium]
MAESFRDFDVRSAPMSQYAQIWERASKEFPHLDWELALKALTIDVILNDDYIDASFELLGGIISGRLPFIIVADPEQAILLPDPAAVPIINSKSEEVSHVMSAWDQVGGNVDAAYLNARMKTMRGWFVPIGRRIASVYETYDYVPGVVTIARHVPIMNRSNEGSSFAIGYLYNKGAQDILTGRLDTNA